MFLQLSQSEQEEVLHRGDDGIRVRRGCKGEVGVRKLGGDDGRCLDEECFAAVGSEAVLDEVKEAACMLDDGLLEPRWSSLL